MNEDSKDTPMGGTDTLYERYRFEARGEADRENDAWELLLAAPAEPGKSAPYARHSHLPVVWWAELPGRLVAALRDEFGNSYPEATEEAAYDAATYLANQVRSGKRRLGATPAESQRIAWGAATRWAAKRRRQRVARRRRDDDAAKAAGRAGDSWLRVGYNASAEDVYLYGLDPYAKVPATFVGDDVETGAVREPNPGFVEDPEPARNRQRRRLAVLGQALSGLTERQRKVVEWSLMEEKPVPRAEQARRLGCSASTVKRELRAAKEAIRAWFAAFCPDDGLENLSVGPK